MNKKATIRDVAERAGVSISTVHQALNDKPGVGAATRERIRAAAGQLGYQPNTLASSLKRKTRRIAVLLPTEGGRNRYYYPPVWRGVREYLASASDLNLECTELCYHEDPQADAPELERLHGMLQAGALDGLLTAGHIDIFSAAEWDELRRSGVAVVQIGSDNPQSHSLCCVQPDYKVIGRTMAELMLSHIPCFGSIVMCAGNALWEPHELVVRGFEEYMADTGAQNLIYKDRSWDLTESSYRSILQLVRRPDIAACCSVLSQSSLLLGRALEESGKAGSLFAVGSDLASENVDYLKRGVMNNLIQKNPYAQGFLAMRVLAEFLAQGRRPEHPRCYVGSEVVFRSNLAVYAADGGVRPLLAE